MHLFPAFLLFEILLVRLSISMSMDRIIERNCPMYRTRFDKGRCAYPGNTIRTFGFYTDNAATKRFECMKACFYDKRCLYFTVYNKKCYLMDTKGAQTKDGYIECGYCNPAVDCQMSEWGEFGKCTAYCGNGVQTRHRTVKKQSFRGGAACGVLSNERSCKVRECGYCMTAEEKTASQCGYKRNYAGCLPVSYPDKDHTVSGKTCQSWNSQRPHYQLQAKNLDEKTRKTNYCRNPGNTATGPWCYTTDPKTRWEHCFNICPTAYCMTVEEKTASQCNKKPNYEGCLPISYPTKDRTVSGRTCQRWDSQTPHVHEYGQYVDKAAKTTNYCRNPSNQANGPWCYTTDPEKRWESCFDTCEKARDYMTAEEKTASQCGYKLNYAGCLPVSYKDKDHTVSGKTCQSWNSQEPHYHLLSTGAQRCNLQRNRSAGDTILGHRAQMEARQGKNLDEKTRKTNYCRNPGYTATGPWCYTTDPNTRWEHCFNICPTAYCMTVEQKIASQCNKKPNYEGCLPILYPAKDRTVSGRTCQRWDSQTPHVHGFGQYVDKAAKTTNYCRNPSDEANGPWCYTTDPEKPWESCFDTCKRTRKRYGPK